ncbi:MAG: DeoR/GlpR family DNA-binding transcription regulator [Clostridiales bacterium]|nr:DeoR/GlpR family DNA-binding transcription regulator [Clostridiales bacterium]
MASDIRRQKIVDIVNEHGSISCVDLSRIFSVTPETIRRDLASLQEQGAVIRTHGGAIACIEFNMLPSELRKQEHFEQKLAIARRAASFIDEKDVIFLDAGTTVSLVCEFLPQDREIFVVTNSSECVAKLADKENITLISTGGVLHRKTKAFTGENAMNTLKSAALNKAFISAFAVSEKYGVMDSNVDEASLNRVALEKAAEAFLLADASKFGKIAYINVCPIDAISTIITDSRLDKETIASLERIPVTIVLADSEPPAPETET